jgi:putative transposase
LPLGTQAQLLSISRRSLYYQPKAPPPEEVAIKHRIDELYTAHPFYGSRKLTVLLEREFAPINRKRVQRYMREMGIMGICPGPNLSKRAAQHRIYPYLLRDVTAQTPNQIWGCDITYVRLRGSWMYLVAILDWFSRYVVSWALDDRLELPFVLDAITQALRIARPQIWNTDQGSQFTSPQLTSHLEAAGVQISMDGKGRAYDNIFTERLWRSLKYEEIYLADYGSPREARAGIGQYFQFYNSERPHQALDYRCPADLYLG